MTLLLAIVNIILIDIVLSGDNALIIGMAVKNLPDNLRKKAIFRGTIAATIMRIIFSLLAVYLLQIVGLKLLGGCLLMYVVWKFYKNLRLGEDENHHANANDSLLSAIWVIVVADISLSLDNVLAVAGVAHGNRLALGFGLLLSVILMAIASTYVAKLLTKYSWIQWIGLFIILFVSCEMLLEGSHEIETKILHFNIIPYLIGLVMFLHMWLHDRYIVAGDENLLKQFLSHHYFEIISGMIAMIVLFVLFGHQIYDYIWLHPAMGLTGIVILLGFALELMLLKGGWRTFFGAKKSMLHHKNIKM